MDSGQLVKQRVRQQFGAAAEAYARSRPMRPDTTLSYSSTGRRSGQASVHSMWRPGPDILDSPWPSEGHGSSCST